jgi:hypothetical protein
MVRISVTAVVVSTESEGRESVGQWSAQEATLPSQEPLPHPGIGLELPTSHPALILQKNAWCFAFVEFETSGNW